MGIQKRLTLLVWTCAILIIAALMSGVQHYALYGIQKKARDSAIGTAQSAARMVDLSAHSTIRTSADQSLPAYKTLTNRFEEFMKQHPDVRHVYTLVQSPKPYELKFIVDVGDDPPIIAEVGCTWSIKHRRHLLDAFQRPIADSRQTTDKWGVWQSAYAPLRDPITGNVTAVIGIDKSATDYIPSQIRVRNWIRGFMVLFILLSGLLSIRIGKVLTAWAMAMAEQANAARWETVKLDSNPDNELPKAA